MKITCIRNRKHDTLYEDAKPLSKFKTLDWCEEFADVPNPFVIDFVPLGKTGNKIDSYRVVGYDWIKTEKGVRPPDSDVLNLIKELEN